MRRIKIVLAIISLIFLIGGFNLPEDLYAQGSGYANLTRGWDIFGEPLSSGSVKWHTNHRGVAVHFELRGAKPNHAYTVGVHLFNPYNKTARVENNVFGGYSVGGEGVINREGNTAYTVAWDFGQLYTDGRGDGLALFDLTVPPGTYYCQFTVRIGGEGTCLASQGITHGCGVVYRTGNRFAQDFEAITIGGAAMGGGTGRSYTAQPYGRQYTSQPYGRQYTSPPVSIQPPLSEQPPIQQVQPPPPPPPPPPPRQDEDEFTRTYRRVDEYLKR